MPYRRDDVPRLPNGRRCLEHSGGHGLEWDGSEIPDHIQKYHRGAGPVVAIAESGPAGDYRAEGDDREPAGTSIPGASQRVPVYDHGPQRDEGSSGTRGCSVTEVPGFMRVAPYCRLSSRTC